MASPRTTRSGAAKARPAKAAPVAPAAAPVVEAASAVIPNQVLQPAPAPIAPTVPAVVAAPAPEPELQPSVGDAGVLRVRSVSERTRYRAGRAFGPEPVDVPIAELTSEEFIAINDDPYLIVEAPAEPGPATSEG